MTLEGAQPKAGADMKRPRAWKRDDVICPGTRTEEKFRVISSQNSASFLTTNSRSISGAKIESRPSNLAFEIRYGFSTNPPLHFSFVRTTEKCE